MLTISKPLSAGQAQTYHKEEFVNAQENYYSFLKSEVSSVKREFRSIMPDGYGKLFAKGELDDLIAYLASLRGNE